MIFFQLVFYFQSYRNFESLIMFAETLRHRGTSPIFLIRHMKTHEKRSLKIEKSLRQKFYVSVFNEIHYSYCFHLRSLCNETGGATVV
jgi:DUF1365 family protein